MFDSTPPNLPVEPQSAPSAAPPFVPAASPIPEKLGLGMPPAAMVSSSKKEPEDIFAEMEQGARAETDVAATIQDTGRGKSGFLKWVAVAGIAFVLFGGLGFATWYFLIRAPAVVEVAPVITKEPVVAEQVEQPPVIEQPIVTETPVSSINVPPPVPTPAESIQPVEGNDADGDGLTDVEEWLYGADPALKDTDGDGFTDGSEVVSLYSPKAKSWPLSAESDMQKLSWKNWNFLLPGTWSLSQDPVVPERLFITTGAKARIKVEAEALPAGTTLELWAPANLQPYESFNTKNGLQVLQSQSNMDAYYAVSGDSVLIVTYDLNGDPSYEYRTSLIMFLNSLKLGATP